MAVLVMGVAGAGKTTLGARLAARLGRPFLDADSLHGPADVAKMAAGVALTDEDRWPWLDRCGARLAERPDLVIACSALKRSYRDRLRAFAPGLRVVFLALAGPELARRLAGRPDHYFNPVLMASQLAALEPPGPQALTLDGARPLDALVDDAARWLA